MIEIEEAQSQIIQAVSSVSETENITLTESLGRVLAKNITSEINVPPADNSAMDGFAVTASDITQLPHTFSVSQRIPAGSAPTALSPNTAARIFTGAEIPENADAVVIQENCDFSDDQTVTLNISPSKGDNIRRQGQDIKSGDVVLSSGQKLSPQHIGLLASIGVTHTTVFRKVRVSILSTGSELIAPGTPLQPGQIYNSNQIMLAQLLGSLGCEVSICPSVVDSLEQTIQRFKDASANSDLIVSSGGVSVGDEDHVKPAVESLGKLNLWKINIKPGKPLAFGHIANSKFLGLPGNPVSAFVTFLLFGIPLVKKLQGQNHQKPMSFFLPSTFAIDKPRRHPEYIRVRIENNAIEKFPNQSSGVLSSTCWANALALIPDNKTIGKGDLLEVLPLDLLQS